MSDAPTPIGINLHKASKTLELVYSDSESYQLSCEYLRVFSPSAEVRGHSPEEAVLQFGKINVTIDSIKPVGAYAIQPTFSDGHDTGIFTWEYLYSLATNQQANWQDYLGRLQAEGKNRDPDVQVVRIGL